MTFIPRIRLTSPISVIANRSVKAYFSCLTVFSSLPVMSMSSSQGVRMTRVSHFSYVYTQGSDCVGVKPTVSVAALMVSYEKTRDYAKPCRLRFSL